MNTRLDDAKKAGAQRLRERSKVTQEVAHRTKDTNHYHRSPMQK